MKYFFTFIECGVYIFGTERKVVIGTSQAYAFASAKRQGFSHGMSVQLSYLSVC